MAGERDLQTLLASLSPRLLADEYVFVQLPDGGRGDASRPTQQSLAQLLAQLFTEPRTPLQPLAMVREDEGLTLVLPRDVAEAHAYPFEGAFRCITLGVHSSLEAVGLTARCAQALTARGIGANVIAGYSHDHFFVPAPRALEALAALQALSGS